MLKKQNNQSHKAAPNRAFQRKRELQNALHEIKSREFVKKVDVTFEEKGFQLVIIFGCETHGTYLMSDMPNQEKVVEYINEQIKPLLDCIENVLKEKEKRKKSLSKKKKK